MRILTLPVDDSIADSYYNAAPQEKSKINSVINLLLGKILKENRPADLLMFIDKSSVEAEKNELTVRKLAELMEWDEDTVKNIFGEDYKIDA